MFGIHIDKTNRNGRAGRVNPTPAAEHTRGPGLRGYLFAGREGHGVSGINQSLFISAATGKLRATQPEDAAFVRPIKEPRISKGGVMKNTMIAVVAGLCLAGCASAHKQAESRHEVWRFTAEGKVAAHEVWVDRYKGGGVALLADPKASQIDSAHTNQTALGGASGLRVGEVGATVNAEAIQAVGDSLGNVIKQAIEGAK